MGRLQKKSKIDHEMIKQIKDHKKVFLLNAILRALVVAVLIRQFITGNYQYVFLCVLVLILFAVPEMVEKKMGILLPDTLEVIILLFIFSAEILGEVQSFYTHFPYWDTVLHTINGFLCAAIGLSLVEILNNSERVSIRLSPFFVAVVAFCFSMTVGVVWEFFEFGMDMLFGLDMQKDTIVHTISSIALDPAGGMTPYVIDNIQQVMINGQDLGISGYLDIGLIDTMEDLLVNFIGALVFSVGGYFSLKSGKKKKWIERFMPVKNQEFRRTSNVLPLSEERTTT